jgi:translation initiation factor eIF-2B subunit gamma
LLSYVLELVEASNIKDIIVVVSGDDAALCIGNWVTEAFHDRLCIEVCAKKNPSLTWSVFSGFIRASS